MAKLPSQIGSVLLSGLLQTLAALTAVPPVQIDRMGQRSATAARCSPPEEAADGRAATFPSAIPVPWVMTQAACAPLLWFS